MSARHTKSSESSHSSVLFQFAAFWVGISPKNIAPWIASPFTTS